MSVTLSDEALETLRTFDLSFGLKYEPDEHQWHGVVSGQSGDGKPGAVVYVDQDPNVAANNAIAQFVEQKQPTPAKDRLIP